MLANKSPRNNSMTDNMTGALSKATSTVYTERLLAPAAPKEVCVATKTPESILEFGGAKEKKKRP
jgi:hypothetical protein